MKTNLNSRKISYTMRCKIYSSRGGVGMEIYTNDPIKREKRFDRSISGKVDLLDRRCASKIETQFEDEKRLGYGNHRRYLKELKTLKNLNVSVMSLLIQARLQKHQNQE